MLSSSKVVAIIVTFAIISMLVESSYEDHSWSSRDSIKMSSVDIMMNDEAPSSSEESLADSSMNRSVSLVEDLEIPMDEKIKNILQHLRNNSGGIPGVQIPDPMDLADFDANVKQSMLTARAPLRNMTLDGLSSFTIHKVSTNLVQMGASIGLNFTQLKVTGRYSLNGTAAFFRLSGEGDFWMVIKNAYVSGVIQLNVTEQGRFTVSSVDLDCIVQSIQLNFENLLGGGLMASISNTLLNTLSKVMFDSVKPSILEELSATITEALNEQFALLPAQPLLVRSTGSPLDIAIINSAHQIKELGLDPLDLPDHSEVFTRQLVFFTFHGEIHMEKGYMEGLSTLHRTGDVTISYNENVIEVVASLGFAKLEGGYTWRANLMGVKRKGGIHFRIKGLNLSAKVHQPNKKGSTPEIISFEIRDIGQVGVDIDGLGSLDFIIEFLGNFITNVFKKQLSEVLQTEIRDIIQTNLREVNLPF